MNVLSLWREPVYLVMRKDDGLAACGEIDIAALRGRKFVALPEGHAFRKMTENLCLSAGYVPDVIVECFPGEIGSYIMENGAVAFTTQFAVEDKEFDCRDFCTRPVKDFTRTISLLWAPSPVLRPCMEEFLEFVGKEYGC